ncbi:ATP-binding cassette domain-containing protein [Verrucomicrobiota bacterium sgz303538]
MSLEEALVLDGIFYAQGAVSILEGVYMKALPARVCGLFGRNGSGKSTILKVAAGQIRASSGTTIIDGLHFVEPARYARFQKIAYLPQDSMLPERHKVENLIHAFPQSVHRALENPVLNKLRTQRIGQLSGGERRYLELQIVLNLGRRYVLLDEPFTGIAPLLVEQMVCEIAGAAESGVGIVIADHDYRSFLPIVHDAYIVRNKQCRRLRAGVQLASDLENNGYLRPADPSVVPLLASGPQSQVSANHVFPGIGDSG